MQSPAKAKISKVDAKKKSAAKVKISLKKIKYAKGYQICIYGSKNNAKRNKKALIVKATKKLKNKKSLFVKARAYNLTVNKTKIYGRWSVIKQIKVKK